LPSNLGTYSIYIKLLIIGTSAGRQSKIENQQLELSVNVCGEQKFESSSEKLLGILVNNTATFKSHLYGDSENPGLLKQLSTCVGMLKKLRKYIPPSGSKLSWQECSAVN
jgi:hypothetical protein